MSALLLDNFASIFTGLVCPDVDYTRIFRFHGEVLQKQVRNNRVFLLQSETGNLQTELYGDFHLALYCFYIQVKNDDVYRINIYLVTSIN